MKSEVMRMSKFFLEIFIDIVLDIYKFLHALNSSQTTHILLQISILSLIFPWFRAAIICQDPGENEILIEVAVGPSAEDI